MTSSPIIVEFAGLPRSGKTTAANGLKAFMKDNGRNVYIVKERAGCCPIQDKLHPSFNLWTTISFIREFLVAKAQGAQIIIADRGLYDAAIWMELFCHEGKYKDEYNSFKSITNLPLLKDIKCKTYFLFCETEIALNREFERSLVKRQGRIMNPEMLSAYMGAYQKIYREKKPCLVLDTSSLSIAKMLSKIYEKF